MTEREYVAQHHTEQTVREMAENLGTYRLKIYKIMDELGIPRNHYNDKHNICWDCRNALNFKVCSWADRFVYPKGVELEGGRIKTCPIYQEG